MILFFSSGEPVVRQHGKTYWAFPADRNNPVATHRVCTQGTDSLLSLSNFQFRSDIQRPVFCPITNNTGTNISPYNSAGCLDTLRNVLQFLKVRPFATPYHSQSSYSEPKYSLHSRVQFLFKSVDRGRRKVARTIHADLTFIEK